MCLVWPAVPLKNLLEMNLKRKGLCMGKISVWVYGKMLISFEIFQALEACQVDVSLSIRQVRGTVVSKCGCYDTIPLL